MFQNPSATFLRRDCAQTETPREALPFEMGVSLRRSHRGCAPHHQRVRDRATSRDQSSDDYEFDHSRTVGSEKTRHRQMSKASKLIARGGGEAKRSRRARRPITYSTSPNHPRAASPTRYARRRCLRDLALSTCCQGSNQALRALSKRLRSYSRKEQPEFDVRDNLHSIREFLRTQMMRSAGGQLL